MTARNEQIHWLDQAIAKLKIAKAVVEDGSVFCEEQALGLCKSADVDLWAARRALGQAIEERRAGR